MRKILGHDARLFRQEVDPAGRRRREIHHHPVANSRPRKLVVPLNQYRSAFYEFVPYLYGPFSFSLNQEAGKLADKGLLTCPSDKTWASPSGRLPHRPDRPTQRGVDWVLRRFGDHSADELMDYVYSRYPQYTVHSKRKKLAKKAVAEPAVYTAGYEGLSVDGFLYRLVDRGIQHLIDVRHNPIARRFGFHKSTLNRLCDALGIRYSHVPSLGIHSSDRQELDSQSDYDSLFASYRRTTLKRETDSIKQVSQWVTESPSVLVCMEADPCTCHRTHLAAAVAKETSLPVIDLKPEEKQLPSPREIGAPTQQRQVVTPQLTSIERLGGQLMTQNTEQYEMQI